MKYLQAPIIFIALLTFWAYCIYLLQQEENIKLMNNVTINTKVIDMSKRDTIIIVRDGKEKYMLIKLHE